MKAKQIETWEELSGEILSGMREWREGHKRATLTEIEAALDERLSRLRAQMLEDVAQTSEAVEGKGGTAVCPQCGGEVRMKGQMHPRRLQTQGGREIVLEREHGVCTVCGAGFFPLDEELALLAGSLTPRLHEQMVRLGSWIPSFRQAAGVLADFTGVFVSAASSRRYTEEAGAACVAVEEACVNQIEREMPPPPIGVAKLQMSVDGVMVPLVGGEWAEVKNLVIGEIGEPVQERGEQVVHLTNLSYFSRLSTSDAFQRQTLGETHRRGVESAKMVVAVNDGAEWIPGFVNYHRPDALCILDFPHASEYVSQIGQASFGPEANRPWLAKQLHTLKHEGCEPVLTELRTLVAQHPEQADALNYLEKRKSQIDYPAFQAAGLPIGSGCAESGNKLVVEARLKGSGMHWARPHVDPMLALRNVVCNDRWQEDWPAIARTLRNHSRRSKPICPAQRTNPLPFLPLPPPTPPEPPPPILPPPPPPPPAPTQVPPSPRSRRPAANHPWRHSPIGKAAYA